MNVRDSAIVNGKPRIRRFPRTVFQQEQLHDFSIVKKSHQPGIHTDGENYYFDQNIQGCLYMYMYMYEIVKSPRSCFW